MHAKKLNHDKWMAKINNRCRSIATILAFISHIKKKKKKKNQLTFNLFSQKTSVSSTILPNSCNSHISNNQTSPETNQKFNNDQPKQNTITQTQPNVKPVSTTISFFSNAKPETLLLDRTIST